MADPNYSNPGVVITYRNVHLCWSPWGTLEKNCIGEISSKKIIIIKVKEQAKKKKSHLSTSPLYLPELNQGSC